MIVQHAAAGAGLALALWIPGLAAADAPAVDELQLHNCPRGAANLPVCRVEESVVLGAPGLDLRSFDPGRVEISPPSPGLRTRAGRYAHAFEIEGFDRGTLLVRAAPASGRPLTGSASLVPGGARVELSDGLATLPLDGVSHRSALLVRSGVDGALLANPWTESSRGWWPPTKHDGLRWYVVEPGVTYAAGEPFQVVGWVRRVLRETLGPAQVHSLEFALWHQSGLLLERGSVPVDDAGFFSVAVRLPDTLRSGTVSLALEATDELAGVGSWRSPRYPLATGAAEQELPWAWVEIEPGAHEFLPGERVTARARVYGRNRAPLPGTRVSWSLRRDATAFEPPGLPGFTFGVWPPSRMLFETPYGPLPPRHLAPPPASTQRDIPAHGADRSGAADLRALPPAASWSGPSRLVLRATAERAGESFRSFEATTLLHGAGVYLGLRPEQYVVEPGQPLLLDAIVVSPAGAPVPGRPVRVEILPYSETFDDAGRPIPGAKARQSCSFRSAKASHRCSFSTAEPGLIAVRAWTKDASGREVRTELTLLALDEVGADDEHSPWLLVERRAAGPGESSIFRVQSTTPSATGLLVLGAQRRGVFRQLPFTLSGGVARVEVPFAGDDLTAVALLFAPEAPAGVRFSARATFGWSEQASLQVDLRLLHPPGERPGRATVGVRVRSGSGQPVPGAEVVLTAVAHTPLQPEPEQEFPDQWAAWPPELSVGGAALQLVDTGPAGGPALRLLDPAELPAELGTVATARADRASIAARLHEAGKLLPRPAALPRSGEAPGTVGLLPHGTPDPGALVPATSRPAPLIVPGLRTDARGELRVEVALPSKQYILGAAAITADSQGRGELRVGATRAPR